VRGGSGDKDKVKMGWDAEVCGELVTWMVVHGCGGGLGASDAGKQAMWAK
jgi:hypothetical protein